MTDHPHPVDVHVGNRLRVRRTMLGISQERLGTSLGITFQQVQKYERGSNRISASKLFDVAHALDVPISYFFEGYADGTAALASGMAERQAPLADDPLTNRETLDLVRDYYRIREPAVRRRIMDLVKTLAASVMDQ